MNPPFVQIVKEESEVSEPKGPEAVWTPLRAIREEWDNDLDLERTLAAHLECVTNFVKHQKELSAGELEDTKDEIIVNDRLIRKMEVSLWLKKEPQQQKLIEDNRKEQSLRRRGEWEKDMSKKLYLFNELKREYIYGRNLTNRIPIGYWTSPTNVVEESVITLNRLKKLARKMPRISLDKMLTEPANNWSLSMLPQEPNLIEQLCHIFRDNIEPTVTVVIDDTKYYCHSILLGLMSEFFKNRENPNVVYLPGSQIPKHCFVSIYRWMLEPIKLLMIPELLDLLYASHLLGIEELFKQCWLLTHNLLKNTDRILTIYIAAQRVCGCIEREITPYVGRVWMPYACTQEFLNLEFNKVRHFLKMDNLAVNSEMEVFYTAVHWLDGDWPRRQIFANELMQAIRFDLLPFVFLIVFDKRKDGPPALEYIRQSSVVRKVISEILTFRTNGNNIQRNSGVRLRDWIYDPSCSYHHGHKCNAVRFVTYSDFAGYIKWLQKFGCTYGNRIKRYTDDDIVCC